MSGFLSESIERTRLAPRDPSEITPDQVLSQLAAIAASSAGAVQIDPLGRSFCGREVHAATIGRGPRRVLAWSQMHGDEPTHTAALLDLLSWLARSASDVRDVRFGGNADPHRETILKNCTLTLVPMLNPDGAVLGRRENAQGIDVNRDARRLATPEGRMLRAAKERYQPDFAFNLHNQNARSTVGRSRLPSVVALMAPPLDYGCPETEQIIRAKQVAVCFRRAVEPFCPGMISRYHADYMPRAFGEWFQASGVTTVLVEAGGSPDDANFDMAGLHLRGLAATLAAIAGDEHLAADPKEYDALPLDGEIVRFDRLIERATVCAGADQPPFLADIGVNFPGGRRLATGPLVRGVIEEIGDMEVTAGKITYAADGLTCLPGRFAFAPEFTPTVLPTDAQWREFLTRGVTTIVGFVDASDDGQLAALRKLELAAAPIAVGNLAFTEAAVEGRNPFESQRGRIDKGAIADLALFNAADPAASLVFVGGQAVYAHGELTGARGGILLTRPAG